MKERTLIQRAKTRRPVLHLALHREFFDAIAEGRKKTEYREDKAYWRADWWGGSMRKSYFEMATRHGRR